MSNCWHDEKPVRDKKPIIWCYSYRSLWETADGGFGPSHVVGFLFVKNTMNPAEEIVKFWFQEKGYYVQSSIRLAHNKELDILAVKPATKEKIHVEVSVSLRMANYDRNPEQLAEEYLEKKFLSVKDNVTELLGENYDKFLVVGNVSFKNKDILEEFIKMCAKRNIKVINIRQILNEIRSNLSTHTYLNSVIKTVQIADMFK